MLDLNRAERRALWLGAGLFALGAAVRLAAGPDEASWAWTPVAAADSGSAAGVRERVQAGIARAERAARPLGAGERLDPNLAPAVELERLPGIGAARARAIVEAREEEPFRSLDDLARVPGIGPATLRRLAPHISLPAATPPRADPSPDRAAPVLDLNLATPAELERLPGIGPALAARVVAERIRRGRFRSVDDLLAVPGIGPRTLERIRPLVAVR